MSEDVEVELDAIEEDAATATLELADTPLVLAEDTDPLELERVTRERYSDARLKKNQTGPVYQSKPNVWGKPKTLLGKIKKFFTRAVVHARPPEPFKNQTQKNSQKHRELSKASEIPLDLHEPLTITVRRLRGRILEVTPGVAMLANQKEISQRRRAAVLEVLSKKNTCEFYALVKAAHNHPALTPVIEARVLDYVRDMVRSGMIREVKE